MLIEWHQAKIKTFSLVSLSLSQSQRQFSVLLRLGVGVCKLCLMTLAAILAIATIVIEHIFHARSGGLD